MAVDFKKYDSRPSFKLANACWLWFGLPPRDMVDDNSPQRVQNILQELKWRIRARHPEWFPNIPGQTLPKVKLWYDRDEYRAIAKEMLADGAIDRLPAFLFPEERGEPVARGKRPQTEALENLARLIRDDKHPSHLTPSIAQGWLENGVGESEQILGFEDELHAAGIEKLEYARKTETLYITLPAQAERSLKLSSFAQYVRAAAKEGKAQ